MLCLLGFGVRLVLAGSEAGSVLSRCKQYCYYVSAGSSTLLYYLRLGPYLALVCLPLLW